MDDNAAEPLSVEDEIPDELKESPPRESVKMLDKRFEDVRYFGVSIRHREIKLTCREKKNYSTQLLSDIKMFQDSRGNDFQHNDSRKDRLSSVPTITFVWIFQKY